MIRNDVMTEAANACQKADALIVLGTNFYDSMVRFAINHYRGDKHFRDKSADIVIHEEVRDVLPKLVLS